MKGLVMLAAAFVFIAGGVFLIRRGLRMWTTVDYQLNSQQDYWQTFEKRWGMIAMGGFAILVGCSLLYGVFGTWFR